MVLLIFGIYLGLTNPRSNIRVSSAIIGLKIKTKPSGTRTLSICAVIRGHVLRFLAIRLLSTHLHHPVHRPVRVLPTTPVVIAARNSLIFLKQTGIVGSST